MYRGCSVEIALVGWEAAETVGEESVCAGATDAVIPSKHSTIRMICSVSRNILVSITFRALESSEVQIKLVWAVYVTLILLYCRTVVYSPHNVVCLIS